MSQERCAQCEEHAELHKDLFGFNRERCAQCEEHAQLHSAGCGGALLMSLMVCASAAVVAVKKR